MLAVVPPGLLNMTAAKISLNEGHVRGIMFAMGACLVVLFQTYIATLLARYLSENPDVVDVLRQVAAGIFIIITIYFLFIAKGTPKKQVDPKIKSKHSRFFQGMFMSVLNVFPVPFQSYMTVTLSSYGLMDFEPISIISYVSGAVIGSFVVLYAYIFFFEKIKGKTITSQKNMNLIIGGITGVISVVTLLNIYFRS
ncbi:lysine transporter LysE [Tamlana haliotis]|uniref:Lysine transporter LysE n=2 Tax=Pseudotamlana haliotis TaxID=2614804 RepID=A0A6N6MHN5_9FLAO|nr:lysine transporter LysE [Tamlana haliotis]